MTLYCPEAKAQTDVAIKASPDYLAGEKLGILDCRPAVAGKP